MTMTNEEIKKEVANHFGEQSEQSKLFNSLMDDYDLTADDLDNDDIDETIHEIANGNPSVYNADTLEWLANNLGRADQEEAIANGAKSAQEISAFCWYRASQEDLSEAIDYAKTLID